MAGVRSATCPALEVARLQVEGGCTIAILIVLTVNVINIRVIMITIIIIIIHF